MRYPIQKIKLVSIWISLTSMMLFFQSCGNPQHSKDSLSSNSLEIKADFLSANGIEVKKIIQNRCADCHSGNNVQGGLGSFENAQVIAFQGLLMPGQPAASQFYDSIVSGRMPPRNPMPDLEIEFIKKWIESDVVYVSAEEPASEVEPVGPIGDVNFARFKAEVLTNNCNLCHSNGNADSFGGGIALEDYLDVVRFAIPGNAENSELYNLTLVGDMPLSGLPLNNREMEILKTWINQGASL